MTKTSQPVTLGQPYTDTITHVTGVATGRYEYLYGCVRVTLEWGKEGEMKHETFDEQRLVEASTGAAPKSTARSGGPRSDPPSRPQ